MYAIIKDGGKQYRVSPGSSVVLEKKDLETGKEVEFSDVIYYNNEDKVEIGAPLVKGVKVKGVVENHFRGPKVLVFKYRRRKDSRRKQGHRQNYMSVKITDIVKE